MMVNFLEGLVRAVKKIEDSESFERDFETFSTTGVPRNLLRFAGLERKYHPAEAREKDKEPVRKKDYAGAPINRLGDSQIFYLGKYPLEEEK